MGFLSKLFGTGKGPDETSAEPISQGRMVLLWMDPSGLRVLKASIGKEHVTSVVPDDRGGLRELQATVEDVEWAEQINRIAEKASSASNRGDYTEAIRLYREALKLAPGCDLYLMSIGCCYANIGEPRQGLKYLERAAQISPSNARIKSNLAALRNML